MDPLRLRALARRALARARAQGGTPRAPRPRRPALLVCAEDLAEVADGTRLELAAGTRLTPLAQDEAWRRRIKLVEEAP